MNLLKFFPTASLTLSSTCIWSQIYLLYLIILVITWWSPPSSSWSCSPLSSPVWDLADCPTFADFPETLLLRAWTAWNQLNWWRGGRSSIMKMYKKTSQSIGWLPQYKDNENIERKIPKGRVQVRDRPGDICSCWRGSRCRPWVDWRPSWPWWRPAHAHQDDIHDCGGSGTPYCYTCICLCFLAFGAFMIMNEQWCQCW